MVAMTKQHSNKSQRGFCDKEKRLCLPGTYCVRDANCCNAAGIVDGTAMCSPMYTQPCSVPDRQKKAEMQQVVHTVYIGVRKGEENEL